nr:hypothetical protein [Tanacetum cinerariifolium]
YIDTKPNHELIHYFLKNPPYKLTWADKVVPVSEGSPKTKTVRYMKTYKNVSQDIHDQLNAEAEAVQIILTRIDNDIYSTVDACPNALWEAMIGAFKQKKSQLTMPSWHSPPQVLTIRPKETSIKYLLRCEIGTMMAPSRSLLQAFRISKASCP